MHYSAVNTRKIEDKTEHCEHTYPTVRIRACYGVAPRSGDLDGVREPLYIADIVRLRRKLATGVWCSHEFSAYIEGGEATRTKIVFRDRAAFTLGSTDWVRCEDASNPLEICQK